MLQQFKLKFSVYLCCCYSVSFDLITCILKILLLTRKSNRGGSRLYHMRHYFGKTGLLSLFIHEKLFSTSLYYCWSTICWETWSLVGKLPLGYLSTCGIPKYAIKLSSSQNFFREYLGEGKETSLETRVFLLKRI